MSVRLLIPLLDQIIDNTVDLDPEYQRGKFIPFFHIEANLRFNIDVVWPEPKQSGLIDSILRHYYMPPVIFGTYTWIFYSLLDPYDDNITFIAVAINPDDGTEMRTCIDGKQRLTSIQRYVRNL